MATDVVIDFDNPRDKARLWGVLRTLGGRHRVELSRFRPRRSDRANAYYWSVCVPAVQQAIRETQGEQVDPESAHEFAKALFLSRPVIDRRTGELLATVVGSSAVLSTEQFGDYVDHLRQWVAEYAGIVIPEPRSMGFDTQHAATAAGR